MNIFKTIWKKIKNIFVKKEEMVMLDVNKEDFKQTLKVKVEKVCPKRKMVQTHICHGDGLGIKKKLEY